MWLSGHVVPLYAELLLVPVTRVPHFPLPFHAFTAATDRDCYFAASGLRGHHKEGGSSKDHAMRMMRFALAMLEASKQVMRPDGGGPVRLRVGIHSGRVMTGVVGSLRKRYCLFCERYCLLSVGCQRRIMLTHE